MQGGSAPTCLSRGHGGVAEALAVAVVLNWTGTAMALPTRGRVIIETTAGEIDIELWSKVRPKISMLVQLFTPFVQETPKTCRNFIQLAMEGEFGTLLDI